MFLRERFPGRWVLIFSSSVMVVTSSHSIYPTQAALLEFGDLGKLLCGAVLVSFRYVSKLEETFLRTQENGQIITFCLFFKNLSRANFYDHRHVLTAGHCIMGRPITTLAVALGFTDLKQTVGEKLTKINKIIKDLVRTMLSVLERCLQEMVTQLSESHV